MSKWAVFEKHLGKGSLGFVESNRRSNTVYSLRYFNIVMENGRVLDNLL
jgi:hypothetical protein